MTVAKMMTEMNGHSNHPSAKQDTRKMARKNHKMMSCDAESLNLPPKHKDKKMPRQV
jgi:hypothetical protein